MSGNELFHYGMPRRSGRYPWGSGEDPYQNSIGFRGTVSELRKQGLSDTEIARGLGITTTQFRARMSISSADIRAYETAEAIRLKERGMSNIEIGHRMGKNESSIRALLNPVLAERAAITQATTNMLKDNVEQFKYIDIGSGSENAVGVSRTRLNNSIAELVEQGYKIHYIKVEQAGMPGQFTTVKVLGSPDSTYSEIVNNKLLIQPIRGRSEDFGRTFDDAITNAKIENVASSRINVRYKDEGGGDMDGVIQLRRGVEDLDLGQARYAQVRIAVDGTHFLKGMAIYSDDMPDGVDIIFNTNKQPTGNKLDAMKKMETDSINPYGPDNPFGSTIGIQKGALNVIGSTGTPHEEGTWDTWSKNLSSQMLSKQSPALIKKQLGIAADLRKEEFDDIMALTNPAVKKILLEKFADSCDADAVHMQGAAMPRQVTRVLLPVPSIKENNIYAPDFDDGESVVLIRYPHGGTFEIPELIVNNNSKEAKSLMKTGSGEVGPHLKDAVGINPKVAQRLSGADFDGDSVIVIPNPKGLIKTSAPLDALKNFDPKESYAIKPGSNAKRMSEEYKQNQMGRVSNLITDMTIKGAPFDEIARAVRHSMVVIDAPKHNLDYTQSYIDHGIASLVKKYQGKEDDGAGGAATIISRAGSEIKVPERKPGARVGPISAKTGKPRVLTVDPETGAKLYTETGATYMKTKTNKRTGVSTTVEVPWTTTTTRMAEARDAFELSSGTPRESIYANHANTMKGLANAARKEVIRTPNVQQSASAKVTYNKEVKSLNSKLNVAIANSPRERQAQILTEVTVKKTIQADPGMSKEEQKKVRNQALATSRARTGAGKEKIDIEPREWDAIQAGAVSNNTLVKILNNSDLDTVKKYATPRKAKTSMSSSKVTRARNMLESGYTQSEVAELLGVTVSQLNNALYE